MLGFPLVTASDSPHPLFNWRYRRYHYWNSPVISGDYSSTCIGLREAITRQQQTDVTAARSVRLCPPVEFEIAGVNAVSNLCGTFWNVRTRDAAKETDQFDTGRSVAGRGG